MLRNLADLIRDTLNHARFKLAVAFVAGGLAAGAIGSAIGQGFIAANLALSGHVTAQGLPPVGTGCTIGAGSTDIAGTCLTTATSGSIAFATAFVAAPTCLVVDRTATPVAVYATTTAQITLTTVTSAHDLSWTCVGKVSG